MEIDLIDQPEEESAQETTLYQLVRWWENKRLSFNIVVGGSGFLGLWVYDSYELLYYYPEIVLHIILYAITVNAFYSLGWGGEVLRIHYKMQFFSLERFKEILYYGGIFVGVAFTFFLAFLSSLI